MDGTLAAVMIVDRAEYRDFHAVASHHLHCGEQIVVAAKQEDATAGREGVSPAKRTMSRVAR